MNHNNDKNKISPYWLRVIDLINLSQTYPEANNVFIYLDIDTCLNPKYIFTPIETLINKLDYLNNNNWDMYIGSDIHMTLNTGGLIIKNTEWSKQLLSNWWKQYDNAYWLYNYKYNQWTCYNKYGNYCIWAQDGYEQGALNNIYNNNYLESQYHILILNSSILSNNSILLDSFIYHFYGNYNIPFYDIKHDGVNNLYHKFKKKLQC
jgi:hypothetical protein